VTKDKPEKPSFVPIKELPKVDIHHGLFFVTSIAFFLWDPKHWETDVDKGVPLPSVGKDGKPVLPEGNVPMPTSPDELTLDHWNTVVRLAIAHVMRHLTTGIFHPVVQYKNNNIFKGVRLTSNDGPRPSPFLLVEPVHTVPNYIYDSASIDTITMYSERNAKYVKQGWSEESASFSTPWCVGSLRSRGVQANLIVIGFLPHSEQNSKSCMPRISPRSKSIPQELTDIHLSQYISSLRT
jgi:hypothetical protein